MGLRMLREWIIRPLYDREAIIARLDSVETFFDDSFGRAEIRELLTPVRDIERIITRINIGSANARDLLALGESLKVVPELKGILDCYDMPLLCSLKNDLDNFSDIVEKIFSTIEEEPPLTVTDGGIIREGVDSELDELRKASTEGKKWIAQMQQSEQEKTGIKALKIRYNRVFGYYIEVSKSNVHLVPDNYIRKQTLTNGERYITDELKKIENKILGADEKSKALEYKIFKTLRDDILQYTEKIQKSAAAIAAVDVLQSFAEAASKYNYCRPKLTEDRNFRIIQGRHPVLDATMSLTGERFVPNDVDLNEENQTIMIITGPNMAGKSTYIRQVALLALMAHTGSFIPAEKAEIGLIDRIFTRVGAADDISRGQSTFMVEMLETANILNHATERSLVILDEIGRGTSTFDGISIAWAIAEFLHDNEPTQARTLFATHYHELTELAITKKRIKNYNVAVREYGDKIIFLRQIVPGTSDKSYGIHVGRLAGLPEPVITRAKEILENLEINAIAEAGMPALAVHHEPPAPPAAAAAAETEPDTSELPSEKIQSEVSENKPVAAGKEEQPIKFPDDTVFQPSLFD
jgi:DNA mismatch repair protein MutS